MGPNLAKSLAAAQSDIRSPKFDSQSMAYGGRPYKYASLAAVTAAARTALAAHGISILQPVTSLDGRLSVETIIVHTTGEEFSFGTFTAPMSGKLQDTGGSITYVRRYALCAALAIVADDDVDGAEATPPKREPGPDELRERLETVRRRQGIEAAITGKKSDRLAIEGVVEKIEEREVAGKPVAKILLESGDILWLKASASGIAMGSRYLFDLEKTAKGMVVVDFREVA